MIPPTAAEVVAATEVDVLKAASPAKAAEIVAVAGSIFQRITGQTWTSVTVADEPIVRRVIRGLSELTAYQDSPEYLETLSDFDLIQNFSAGPYSESRRSPEDARKARLIVAWPWLSDLLWTLLTEDRYEYWWAFFSDHNLPAFAVQEVDWRYPNIFDIGYHFGA